MAIFSFLRSPRAGEEWTPQRRSAIVIVCPSSSSTRCFPRGRHLHTHSASKGQRSELLTVHGPRRNQCIFSTGNIDDGLEEAVRLLGNDCITSNLVDCVAADIYGG